MGGRPDTELDVTGICDASRQCDKDDTKSRRVYVLCSQCGPRLEEQNRLLIACMRHNLSTTSSEAAMEAALAEKYKKTVAQVVLRWAYNETPLSSPDHQNKRATRREFQSVRL
ncbi:retrotransposon protein, putative, ty1-copia subclass [Tanacetum coccineum]